MEVRYLFLEFVDTKQRVLNRPDAVCFKHGNPKDRSYYQSKLEKIKLMAATMEATNENEEGLLKVIAAG